MTDTLTKRTSLCCRGTWYNSTCAIMMVARIAQSHLIIVQDGPTATYTAPPCPSTLGETVRRPHCATAVPGGQNVLDVLRVAGDRHRPATQSRGCQGRQHLTRVPRSQGAVSEHMQRADQNRRLGCRLPNMLGLYRSHPFALTTVTTCTHHTGPKAAWNEHEPGTCKHQRCAYRTILGSLSHPSAAYLVAFAVFGRVHQLYMCFSCDPGWRQGFWVVGQCPCMQGRSQEPPPTHKLHVHAPAVVASVRINRPSGPGAS